MGPQHDCSVVMVPCVIGPGDMPHVLLASLWPQHGLKRASTRPHTQGLKRASRGPQEGFKRASRGLQEGLKAFAGPDASWQPPDLADLLMHETVAARVRKYFLARPLFKGQDLEKHWQSFEQGMLECEAHINAHHDLAGLCASLPRRVQKLLDHAGDRMHY